MFGMVALFAGVLGISAFMVTDLTAQDDSDEDETEPFDDDAQAEGDAIDMDTGDIQTTDAPLAPSTGTEGSADAPAQTPGTDAGAAGAPDLVAEDIALASDPGTDTADPAQDDDPFAFTLEELAASPQPLDDFSQEEDLTEVTAGAGDTVNFTLPDDSGTLYVMQADYSESASTEDGEESFVYSGYNVYYVPEGQSFPEEYEWSEEGATLYNAATYQQDDADFGEIRMIARIDSGYTATDTSYEDGTETVQDNTIGTPAIEANCRVFWA